MQYYAELWVYIFCGATLTKQNFTILNKFNKLPFKMFKTSEIQLYMFEPESDPPYESWQDKQLICML